jgi:hypothetical protein
VRPPITGSPPHVAEDDPHHVGPRPRVVVARCHGDPVTGGDLVVQVARVDRRQVVGVLVVGDGAGAGGDARRVVPQRDVDAAVVEVASGEDCNAVTRRRPRPGLRVDAFGAAVTRHVVSRVAASGDVHEVDVERARVRGVGAGLVVERVLDVDGLRRRARRRLVHDVVDRAPLVVGADQVRVRAAEGDRRPLHAGGDEPLGPRGTQAIRPGGGRHHDMMEVHVVHADGGAVLIDDVEPRALEAEGAGRARHARGRRASHLVTRSERERPDTERLRERLAPTGRSVAQRLARRHQERQGHDETHRRPDPAHRMAGHQPSSRSERLRVATRADITPADWV